MQREMAASERVAAAPEAAGAAAYACKGHEDALRGRKLTWIVTVAELRETDDANLIRTMGGGMYERQSATLARSRGGGYLN